MQESFGCVVANRFHQLLDDESDPFDVLREAERRRQQQRQRKRRQETAVAAVGSRGGRTPAGAPGHRPGASGGRRESQKERKGLPASGPQPPDSPGGGPQPPGTPPPPGPGRPRVGVVGGRGRKTGSQRSSLLGRPAPSTVRLGSLEPVPGRGGGSVKSWVESPRGGISRKRGRGLGGWVTPLLACPSPIRGNERADLA